MFSAGFWRDRWVACLDMCQRLAEVARPPWGPRRNSIAWIVSASTISRCMVASGEIPIGTARPGRRAWPFCFPLNGGLPDELCFDAFIGKGFPAFFVDAGRLHLMAGQCEEEIGKAIDIAQNHLGNRIFFMQLPQSSFRPACNDPTLV